MRALPDSGNSTYDRSIEAAMIRPEFSQLLTADELEEARSSLRAHGVDVGT